MSAPDPEKRWASNSDTPPPGDTGHSEPVAEEPLEREGSEKELEEGKVVDMEVEETSSQDDDENEKDGGGRLRVRRTQSNWTQTTGTSIATTEAPETEDPARKQTWGEKINPLKHKTLPPVPDKRNPSREHTAGFFSKLTFQWISPLMVVGYQRPLEVNDIWSVNPEREVDLLAEKLKSSLEKRNEAGSKRPLTMALYDTFRKEFLIGGGCQLTAACVQVLSPFTMKYLITFAGEAYFAQVHDTPGPAIGHGVGLVFGITAMQVIQSLCTNHFIYRGMMVGGQVRSVLIAVIFEKAMKLSGRAKAGGKAKDQADEEIPESTKPDSKEEKGFFKKKLGKEKPRKGVFGDGQGWSNGRIVNL